MLYINDNYYSSKTLNLEKCFRIFQNSTFPITNHLHEMLFKQETVAF